MKDNFNFGENCQRLYTKAQLATIGESSSGFGLETLTPEEVLWAFSFGVATDNIFFTAPGKASDDIRRTMGKCRFLANSLVELHRIHEVVEAKPAISLLEPVALCVVPAVFEGSALPGIPEKALPMIAREVRSFSSLAIRGCFFRGNLSNLHGEKLGRYFRTCYELSKRISTLLPCKVSWLGILGGWEAAERNAAEHPETFAAFQREIEIVVAQNRSTFYARLILT